MCRIFQFTGYLMFMFLSPGLLLAFQKAKVWRHKWFPDSFLRLIYDKAFIFTKEV